MRADKFEIKTGAFNAKYVEQYVTVWAPQPDVQISIGAPTLKGLKAAWSRIEPKIKMDIAMVHHVRVYANGKPK